jgi:phosphate transport system substrate-binding protein
LRKGGGSFYSLLFRRVNIFIDAVKKRGGEEMRKNILIMSIICVVGVAALAVSSVRNVGAQDVIKYSCSSQIYEAFEKARIDAFTQRTGKMVEVHVCSSPTAVNWLMHGNSDVASSARRLYERHKVYGYHETLFSKDPVAVVVNKQNPMTDIAEDVLQDIFAGEITNWKEIGGADEPILVVVPATYTASYKNFSRNVMHRKKMKFDLMSRLSGRVIQLVEQFPSAISFVAEGAAARQKVKVVKVDGRSPLDMGYPYYQVFSFVTKGKPTGAVKEFIDDLVSGPGREIMKKIGVMPYSE